MRVNGLNHSVIGRDDPPLARGPLAASREAVHEALTNTGFVDVAGASGDNFKTYLDRQPFEMEVGDLKPGMLEDLKAWVASEIANNSNQAQQAQAQVSAEMALKLLT